MPEAAVVPPPPPAASGVRPRLAGIGTALPATAVPSAEIAARLGVEPGWIEQRTGVERRHIAGDGDSLTALAAAAAERALAVADVDPADVDLVLVATFTADRLLPNAAPLVADAIGSRGAFACDLGAACAGFLSGLSLACGQIESGRAGAALVIGADLVSRVIDPDDRKTAGLFGDGAGAAVLTGDGAGDGAIERILLRSDARRSESIVAGRDERLMRMRGQDTFRAAVGALTEVTAELLEAEGLRTDEVDLFVYHQANARITAAVGDRLGLPRERVVDCIAGLGNTSAATIPLALAHADCARLLRPGSRLLLGAFGAGFVWGAGLLRWEGDVAW